MTFSHVSFMSHEPKDDDRAGASEKSFVTKDNLEALCKRFVATTHDKTKVESNSQSRRRSPRITGRPPSPESIRMMQKRMTKLYQNITSRYAFTVTKLNMLPQNAFLNLMRRLQRWTSNGRLKTRSQLPQVALPSIRETGSRE